MGLAVNPVTANGVTYGYYTFGMTTANSATAPNCVKATADTSVRLGTWSHVTATYYAQTRHMEVYVDGVPAAGATPSATWSSGCNTFTLGRFNEGSAATRYFNGKIADVQAWPGTALTATQIAQFTVISLRAHANNMIVTAANAGAWPLIANRTAIGPWEEFDLIYEAESFAIRSAPSVSRAANDWRTIPLVTPRRRGGR